MSLEEGIPSFTIEVDFLKGAKGDTGFSPRIEVASLTSAEYILRIINEDGEILTPNLKGDLSMDDYVLKEEGMGLSRNSFEDDEKQKLQELHNYDDTEIRESISTLQTNLEGKIESDINQSQQDLLDDMSKTYTGTNITGPTVEGYGTIHKLYGNTIEEGTGEKSPSNPHVLKCVGDDVNLFDGEILNDYGYNSTTGQQEANKGLYSSKNFNSIKGSQLVSSVDLTVLFIRYFFYDKNKSFLSSVAATVVDVPNNACYFKWQAGKNNVSNVNRIKIQKGSIATPYSPYNQGTVEIISKNGDEQSSNVIVTKPLCCLKDNKGNIIAQDYIDYTRGVVHRECGYLVLDGNTNIKYMDASNNTARFMVVLDNIKSITTLKCDKLKVVKQSEVGDEECVIIRDLSSDNIVNIRVKRDRLSEVSTAGIKNYLSSAPINIIYQLATPIEEPIDCSNKIVQYANETTVSNRDGAEIEVSLTNNKAISEVNEELGGLRDKTVTVDLISEITSDFGISTNRSQFKKVNDMYNLNLFIGSNTVFGNDITIANIPTKHTPNNIEFLQFPVMLQNLNSQVIGIGRASIKPNGQISLHHDVSNVYRIVLSATYIK